LSGYADTSFLVSLYTPDANSNLAAEIMERVDLPLFLTAFGEVELANAFELRLYRREVNAIQIKAASKDVLEDIESRVFVLKAFSPAIFERSKLLIQRHSRELGVRTLDLMHVASALVLEADIFYSFNLDQRKLALAVGLRLSQ
jgi:predicted nucleic acid-binding protein